MQPQLVKIDLTLQKTQLLDHLIQKTVRLRQIVMNARASKQLSISYQVKFKDLVVYGLKDSDDDKTSIKLLPKAEDAQKQPKVCQKPQTFQFKQQSIARVQICTRSIYPAKKGHIRLPPLNTKNTDQCCKLKINGLPYVSIGINYPQNKDGRVAGKHQLVHHLGILIAQSIRFNTLDLIKAYIDQDFYYDSTDLFELIFLNFNFKTSIVRSWQTYWGKPEDKKNPYYTQRTSIPLYQTSQVVKVKDADVVKLLTLPSYK